MYVLSICIPTYRRPKFLSETLNSIIFQCSNSVEIVVSDNCSQDGTVEVLSDYQKNFPNITYFEASKNEGIDRNLVNLLDMAQGKYIFFVSDDDIILPGTIQQILKSLSQHDPDILYLNHFPFFGDLKHSKPPFYHLKTCFLEMENGFL